MDQETSPREQFLASQEILSTIEWIDVLQGHASAIQAMALFNVHMGILLEGTCLCRSQTRVHGKHSSDMNWHAVIRVLEVHYTDSTSPLLTTNTFLLNSSQVNQGQKILTVPQRHSAGLDASRQGASSDP